MLVVALAGGFAWLTRHPEAQILAQAENWPLVGSFATGFRQAYLPPDPAEADESRGPEGDDLEVVWVPARPEDFEARPEDLEIRPYIWVQPGNVLYERPDLASPILLSADSIRNLLLLEQRDDWYRVLVPRFGDRPLHAWVYLEAYEDPSPEALSTPDPVVPLGSSPPNPDSIEAARLLMEDQGREADCGPYRVFTDQVAPGVLELCPQVTEDLERIYRNRYGLEPVSPPAEAILLFRRASAYQAFRDREQVPFESSLAHASPADGYVALFRGDRSTLDVVGTLIHELTHLLNRRALGPALPPWLGEGLADDLAESRIDDRGSLEPGRLGGESRFEGLGVTRRGAIAAATDLQKALKADDLPRLDELMQMDRQRFHDPARVQLHYALSSFWVRYLLSGFDPDLERGFRAFLQEVARGEPITRERFEESLGATLSDLELGFRAWVHLQFLTAPSETRAESP